MSECPQRTGGKWMHEELLNHSDHGMQQLETCSTDSLKEHTCSGCTPVGDTSRAGVVCYVQTAWPPCCTRGTRAVLESVQFSKRVRCKMSDSPCVDEDVGSPYPTNASLILVGNVLTGPGVAQSHTVTPGQHVVGAGHACVASSRQPPAAVQELTKLCQAVLRGVRTQGGNGAWCEDVVVESILKGETGLCHKALRAGAAILATSGT